MVSALVMRRRIFSLRSARKTSVLQGKTTNISPWHHELLSRASSSMSEEAGDERGLPCEVGGASAGSAALAGGHREVKNVLVVGGGVAGLAAAACLGRIGVRVTLTTRGRIRHDSSTTEQGYARAGSRLADPGVGIWSHGLECLDRLGVLRQLESEGRYMGEAGYRDTSGNWLARPSQPLQHFGASDYSSYTKGTSDEGTGERTTGSGASVLFVRESKLIEALRSTLGEDTNTIHCEADDLEWNKSAFSRDVVAAGASRVQTRTPSDRPAGIDSCGGEASPARTGDFDLLVGADGLDSPIRRQALGETAGEAEPVRRGYVVYRGVCAAEGGAAGAGWDLESFQTWGAGKRFASVPLAGAERMWFATIADGVFPDMQRASAPQPSAIKPFLMETFGAWHEPISTLLQATKGEHIVWEDARAMSSKGLRVAGSWRPAKGGRGGESSSMGGVALVGDAAHTLDPVLAQGAGVALEDAFFLARCVRDFNEATRRSNGARVPTGSPTRAGRLEAALAGYDAERLDRSLLLSRLSNLSQSLGQLRSPLLGRVRTSVFTQMTPSILRSRVFDGLMGAALAGGSASAARAAAASAGVWGVRSGSRSGGYGIPDV